MRDVSPQVTWTKKKC